MKYIFCILMIAVGLSLKAQKNSFKLIDRSDKKQVDVLYNDQLLTSYCYYDSIMKPVLFPINTISGITVSRGFPLAPRPGERTDHPHHIGMWLNYESVNGLDFWNNSTAIPYDKRSHYGSIIHTKVITSLIKEETGTLEVTAQWIDHTKKNILKEQTQYQFKITGNNFIIDRITTLSATYEEVDFKDVKDGFLGFRVARELELPSDEPQTFIDNSGNPTTVPVIDNTGVSGEYLSSEGLKGNDVWASRGRWVTLHGIIKEPVSVTIIDHPGNIGYPTYWHARGYGLFAANPLGQEVFSKGKEKLNFKLNKGKSVTFRYRVVIHEGSELTKEEIEKLATEFKASYTIKK